MEEGNVLYYGDNLDILRRYIKDGSVDLIYLDPPFKSNQTYNVLFAEKNGSPPKAQIKAFGDTWRWDNTASEAWQSIVETGPEKASQVMQAFRKFLGCNDMLAYLSMMAPRLVELRRVLKPTGSIYLHCDPTAGHYLKLLMDAVVGVGNFRNEVVWKRTSAHSDPKRYGNNTDRILYYTKSDSWTWNDIRTEHDATYLKRFRHRDTDGRLWTDDNLTAKGLTGGGYEYEYKGVRSLWRVPLETMRGLDDESRLHFTKKGGIRLKRYLDETDGVRLQTLWDDIPPINSQAKERLGYPTQKPESLLQRIIEASSNPGDVVLDPFCGCGTAVAVAERLGRQWIGIDITHLAITLIKHRLQDAFGNEATYEVVGEPIDLASAKALAKQDPYQFQWWALGLVNARPGDPKKGADKGIDGRIYFHDEAKEGKTKQIVFSVKAGHVTVSQIRDLHGVVEREKAAIGVFICLREPTQPMRSEAASAGFYHSPGWEMDYTKLQLLTIEELLAGKRIDCPPLQHTSSTFKKGPKRNRKRKKPEQSELF